MHEQSVSLLDKRSPHKYSTFAYRLFFFFGHDFSLVPNILQTVTFYTRFLQLGSYR